MTSHPTFLQHQSIAGKVMVLVGLALLSLGIFSVLSIVLVSAVFHLPVLSNPAILTQTNQPDVVPALKLMQVMQAFGIFIVPALVFARLESASPMSYLSLNKKPLLYSAFCVALLMLGAQPLINWMAEMNNHMPAPQWMHQAEQDAERITEIFLKMNSSSDLLVNLLMIGFIPAVGEELLFRGALQPLLQKLTKNPHLGIWLSAILFSALHMQFLGFFPRMFMGAAFGYMLWWSGSIWLPVIGHFVNNAGAVLIAYMVQGNNVSQELETVGAGAHGVIYVPVSLLFVSILFVAIRKREKEHMTQQID